MPPGISTRGCCRPGKGWPRGSCQLHTSTRGDTHRLAGPRRTEEGAPSLRLGRHFCQGVTPSRGLRADLQPEQPPSLPEPQTSSPWTHPSTFWAAQAWPGQTRPPSPPPWPCSLPLGMPAAEGPAAPTQPLAPRHPPALLCNLSPPAAPFLPSSQPSVQPIVLLQKLLRPPASPGGKAGLVHEPQAPEASPNLLPALPCPLARPPCGLWRCHAHSWTWVLRPGLPPSLCHLPTRLTTLPCLLAPWTLQCPPPFAPSAWAAPSSPQAYPPPTAGAPAPGTSPAKPPPRLQVAPGLVGNRQRGPSSRSHPPSAGPQASSRPQIHTSEAGQPSTEGRAAPCPGSET